MVFIMVIIIINIIIIIMVIIMMAIMGRGLVRRLSEDLVELPEGEAAAAAAS